MKNLIYCAFLFSIAIGCNRASEPIAIQLPDNPLFAETNEPIPFNTITATDIEQAAQLLVDKKDEYIQQIASVPDGDRTFNNTLLALDNFSNLLSNVFSPIYLIGSTHPDSTIREMAIAKRTELSKLFNDIGLNEDLYNAVKAYSTTKDAQSLQGYKKKFLVETLEQFERNGFALAVEERQLLKDKLNEISETGNAFNTNIAKHQDFLFVSEAELKGLPDDYKKSRLQEDGTYKIGMSYPDVGPVFKLAENEEVRRQLAIKFANRAADTNLEVLRDLVNKRTEMANMLGYDTYSAYILADRMAQTPETVWDFEKSLRDKVRPKAEIDLKELKVFKHSMGMDSSEITPWENGYLSDKMLNQNYGVDSEKVKEYFELENVKEGLFAITQKLFNVTYKKVDVPVWHEDVTAYEVLDNGKVIGRFYLDLHPRPNKYGHAACFPMVRSKNMGDTYQYPVATLVCNFPEPTEDKPALLPHGTAETFFHEFGHVLHNMFSKTELSSQAGTQVARDFVEAPSQIFENWVWDYESLSLFAKHYETGELLPEALFNKMLAAKNVNSGISALGQVHYGIYDMTLYDGYKFTEEEDTGDLWHRLYKENTVLNSIPGTHPEASFGHLNGYGSSYYGYMWSLVYAQDMFSKFEEEGILNPKVGQAYREHILSKGSTVDEMQMLKNFLGREPNDEAFVKSLGL
ncbi:MAG: M3 family metallopeptidase [Fulvivirga sp.]|uniref:M3 family metallopeptidase n=1 Tax=Fulvivirga sp. TaxID=1931237 RepID=UPI0032EBF4E7